MSVLNENLSEGAAPAKKPQPQPQHPPAAPSSQHVGPNLALPGTPQMSRQIGAPSAKSLTPNASRKTMASTPSAALKSQQKVAHAPKEKEVYATVKFMFQVKSIKASLYKGDSNLVSAVLCAI